MAARVRISEEPARALHAMGRLPANHDDVICSRAFSRRRKIRKIEGCFRGYLKGTTFEQVPSDSGRRAA